MLLVLTGSYDHVHIEKEKKCLEKKKVGTTSWKRRKILESCFNQSNLENCFQVILSSKTDVLDI